MVDYNSDDLQGKYESLAGRKSGSAGLVSHGGSNLPILATGVDILAQNGARVHATIRNSTDADSSAAPTDLWLVLGAPVDADQMLLLKPGEAFVIDKHHPWSGRVMGVTEIGVTSYVDWVEVSVK